MSRAFMKESEPADPRCPECSALGEPVGLVTLKGHLEPEDCSSLGAKAFYCVNSGCHTAYFNAWGVSVPFERMTRTAYPKDPDAPICPCFGMTVAEVVEDARAGNRDRIRDLATRAQGPQAHCAENCPDGTTCLPRVLRLFRETFEAK
jgi:hypothetical protein